MKPISRRTLHGRRSLSALSTILVVTLLSSTAFAWQGGAAGATKQAADASKPANSTA